jgi:hypothetical protein
VPSVRLSKVSSFLQDAADGPELVLRLLLTAVAVKGYRLDQLLDAWKASSAAPPPSDGSGKRSREAAEGSMEEGGRDPSGEVGMGKGHAGDLVGEKPATVSQAMPWQ